MRYASPSTRTSSARRLFLQAAWPFTVEEGTLACDDSQGGQAVTFEAGETVYGVNGFAKTYGYGDIEPIWRDSPDPLAGPKINIGPIIDRGLELCEQ